MAIPVERFLGQSELQQLQDHAARLTRLEAQLQDCLPRHLAAGCHVANLREGELVIHAESSAVAAKLRQLVPSVMSALQSHGAPVSSIKLRVKPVAYRPLPPPPPVREVSAQTLDEIGGLAARLPEDSPLAEALRRFVRRTA